MKKKLELYINSNNISKSNIYFKYLSESVTDIDNLFANNNNIITEVKILDNNQKNFFDKAKEIFNNLKINHKIKI